MPSNAFSGGRHRRTSVPKRATVAPPHGIGSDGLGRIVNLGSLCIDHVYRVPRFARPAETLLATGYARFPGGKGLNQSLAAARAGATVSHAGRVGRDGGFLVDVLASAGVDTRLVEVDPEATSGQATIQVVPDGTNSIVIVGGANRTLDADFRRRAFAGLGAQDWILLQNEINDLPVVVEEAAATAARVALNLAPADGTASDLAPGGIDALIVNAVEAAAMAARDPGTPAEVLLDVLSERFANAIVVITLGAAGLVWAAAGKRGRMAAFAVPAVDETAAGDAFVGYFLAVLAGGGDLRRALRMGSAAGALAVSVAGAATSIPSAAAVRELVA